MGFELAPSGTRHRCEFKSCLSQQCFLLMSAVLPLSFLHRYNEGAKKTRTKIKTLNPIFQEIVSFALEEEDMAETKISVDLFDHDIVGADDFMGQAVIDIFRMNLSNELTTNKWFMLQQQV